MQVVETQNVTVNKSLLAEKKVPDSSASSQKPKLVKTKKKKKPKDSTAPRVPLTGYARYLSDRRESVRAENPNISFAEITKILASEWGHLPADRKQQYLDAAEQDRERYRKEYNAYKQTEAYKLFTKQQNEKKLKGTKDKLDKITQPVLSKDPQDMNFGNLDIPIFTEEFLDHNKTRDGELRQLRKINSDYEQQNAILTKHIENMKSAITKLESEIMQQEKNNASLQQLLDHLRNTLADGFCDVNLPGMKEVATLQNIDNYMTNLHSILLENSSHDTNLLQTVRDIIGKLEFNG
ncbi:unnamed protein product [Callosobruchus maculatus]|uniref:HMG box domain-containing protein n=1 Tax=Callosobruchus maculatus TaxID=64391 RepID=A0A653BD41_CALMS|nr:unnamed protein product [Callosobruchus maculatus]